MPINLLSFDVSSAAPAAPRAQGAKPAARAQGAAADAAPATSSAGAPAARPVDKGPKPAAARAPQLDGRPPKNDPFVAVIREAVRVVQRTLKGEAGKAASAETAPRDRALDPETAQQAEAALALLAQFASMMPGLIQPVGDNAQAGNIAALAAGQGVGTVDAATLQDLLAAGDVQIQLPSSDIRDHLAGMSLEMRSRMQALIEQMQAVAQGLEPQAPGALPEAVDRSAAEATPAEAAIPQAAAPAAALPQAAAGAAPAAQAPTPQTLTASGAAARVEQPSGRRADRSALPNQASATPADKAAALDVLLKPLRGELHVENEFALKGPRLVDVAYSEPVADARLLQSLDEQGKGLAIALRGDKAQALSAALGIHEPEAAPQEGGIELATAIDAEADVPTLLATAVDAADVDQGLGSNLPDNGQQALKSEGERAEGIHGSALASASGPVPGGPLEQAGGPSKAQQAVMQQVIDRVKELAPGPASIRMVLQPESLGQLTIRLTSHQGQVSVRVLTENADVQRLLDGNLGHLKAALVDAGIKLDNVQVVQLPPQSQQQQGEQGQRQPQQQPQAEHRQDGRQDATDEERAALERLWEMARQLEG